eukprot:6698285-Lingulodinium_polyedra.AAC.1
MNHQSSYMIFGFGHAMLHTATCAPFPIDHAPQHNHAVDYLHALRASPKSCKRQAYREKAQQRAGLPLHMDGVEYGRGFIEHGLHLC